MSNCKTCNGAGFYYCLPPGKNAFEMSIDTLEKVTIRYECSCIAMTGFSSPAWVKPLFKFKDGSSK